MNKEHLRTSTSRVLLASLAGTTIEFYDFFIYGTAASLIFGPLFFVRSTRSGELLLAYASFSIAFLSRPLGAVIFGHLGDRAGRKSTLIAALFCMGVSTTAIGILPTYETAGWAAPCLLCLLRFGQGLGLGGEWGGAALLAVENSGPTTRARFGMFPQLGAPLGFLLANGAFLLLTSFLAPSDLMRWGWRIPFLLSSVLVGVGLWVRSKLTETPVFFAMAQDARTVRFPINSLLSTYARQTVYGILGVVACFAIFYICTTFTLGYATATLGYNQRAMLLCLLSAIPFLAIGIIISGYLSDLINPRYVLIAGCVGGVILGLVFAPALTSGSMLRIWLFLSIALFVMGFAYGPLGAWLPSLFPPSIRYTGISVAFTVGGLLGGGIAPSLAQVLTERGGLRWVGFYLSVAISISLAAIVASGFDPHNTPGED
jgi:MFS family permease